jgi:osmotically-inducible protein OsmY
VKVITLNGHVTLRGPVKTTEEKKIIGELAAQQVTPANVANQLEVEMKN